MPVSGIVETRDVPAKPARVRAKPVSSGPDIDVAAAKPASGARPPSVPHTDSGAPYASHTSLCNSLVAAATAAAGPLLRPPPPTMTTTPTTARGPSSAREWLHPPPRPPPARPLPERSARADDGK